MDFQSYLQILRKRWRVILATTFAIVALALIATALTPRTYQSKVEFFVSTSDSSDSSQLAQGSTFTQARVKSYTQLLKTRKVLDPVARAVPQTSATDLADQVTSSVPPDTVLIDVAVADSSPKRAQRIAQAISNEFPSAVTQLESVNGKSSPVKVTVVQQPSVATSPVSPRPMQNIALGVLLGLLLGIALAVVRDRLDNRVRDKDDIKALTDAPLIGSIPFDAEAPAHPLIITSDASPQRAESFRSLRTNLRFVDAAKHPRVIVVTSSRPGEGKTTTTANLAIALAEMGSSVVVIEGDLRRPRLLRYLGMEGAVGLTDLLIERVGIDDAVQRFGQHNLAVMGAGQLPPNPSELLGSEAMRATLEQLRQAFDYVVIDAPPLLAVTDAAVLSALTDGTLLVAASGDVTTDQVETALESLEGVDANLLGVVLNKVPRGRSRTQGYYDYSYSRDEDTSGKHSRKRLPQRSLARHKRGG